MATSTWGRRGRLAALVAAGVGVAMAACTGDPTGGRRMAGEAAIDVRGFMSQTQSAGSPDEIIGLRLVVSLVLASSRKEVATKVFTNADLTIAENDSTVVLRMTFPYTSSADQFEVSGQAFTALGDTLFRVGPQGFTLVGTAGQTTTVSVPAVYVGPGATAVRLTITPRTLAVSEGQPATATATLFDAQGTALPTVGVQWWSLTPEIGVVFNNDVGTVTAGFRPGTGKLVASWDPKKLQDTITFTNTVKATQLVIAQGGGQTTRVGTQFTLPINVQARSAGGFPVAGVPVSFVVTQGGGSVSKSVATTVDPTGVAVVTWVAGPTAGPQALTASVAGVPSVVIFGSATAANPDASQSSVTLLPNFIKTGGEQATVTVILRDTQRNPVPNTVVSFSGAGVTFSAPTATTDLGGLATTKVSAAAAGTFTINVSAGGQLIGAVNLSVAAAERVAANIAIVSGDNQTVSVGSNFPLPLVVVVRDAAGAPLPGAQVNWGTAAGPQLRTTDLNGQSSAPYALPANWPLGSGTVTAAAVGTNLIATFKYTAVP